MPLCPFLSEFNFNVRTAKYNARCGKQIVSFVQEHSRGGLLKGWPHGVRGSGLESLCLIPGAYSFFYFIIIIIILKLPFQPLLTFALALNGKEKLHNNKRAVI